MRKKVEDKLLENSIIKLLSNEIMPLTVGEITTKLNKKSKRSTPVVKRHILKLVEEGKIITDGIDGYMIAGYNVRIVNRCAICGRRVNSSNPICARCALNMRRGTL